MENEWGYLFASDGAVTDPEGRKYATVSEGRIIWLNSLDGGRISVPAECVVSAKPGAKPGTAAVAFSDGEEHTYEGAEDIRIFEAPPEKSGGKITDLGRILGYVLKDRMKTGLWTDYHTGARHIDMSMIGEESGELDVRDASIPMRRFVEAQSALVWGRPLNVTDKDMTGFLEDKAKKTVRNRFLEAIRSREEKDSPRWVSAYRLFGASGLTAPAPDISEDEEAAYVDWGNRAVLLAAIERQHDAAQVDKCPVFIGPQGTGKTSLCRFLGGRWYRASTQNVRDTKQFMESTNGAVIAEFREGLQTLNPETLKDFLDSEKVQFRKPYEKAEHEYPITFVTAITTNDPQPLLDLTGARRFLPLYMDPARQLEQPWALSSEDWGAVWGRALWDYEHGERWRDGWQDVRGTAEKMQAYASRDPPYFEQTMELIAEYKGDKIPRSWILNGLEARLGRSSAAALEALRKNPARFGLEKGKNPQYIGGKSERFYRRIN